MRFGSGWKVLRRPHVASLARPIVIRSQSLQQRSYFPRHSHPWNQLVYAVSGVLVVSVEDVWYVITPEQAIWVPKGKQHATGAFHPSEFRSLYVDGSSNINLPTECRVVAVKPLLKELIVELGEIARLKHRGTDVDQICALILLKLNQLEPQDFALPWPKSKKLRRICEKLYDTPSDTKSVSEWAADFAMSPRTLSRHFENEVGLSLRSWRYRMRLFLSIRWLGEGRSITEIAFELGYASPSAFTYMFRKEMGCSPSQWLKN